MCVYVRRSTDSAGTSRDRAGNRVAFARLQPPCSVAVGSLGTATGTVRFSISNNRVRSATCPRDVPRVLRERSAPSVGRRMPPGMPHVKSDFMLFERAPKRN